MECVVSETAHTAVVGADRVIAGLQATGTMTARERSRAILRGMILMQSEVRSRAVGGPRRMLPQNWGTPGPLGTGTGDYRRRVVYWPPQPIEVGFVGTDRPDALIHEEGGTITAKRSRFLPIPLTAEARRVGSPRKFPGELWPFFPKPFRGAAFLVRQKFSALKEGIMGPARNTKGGRIDPQYLLKRSVTLRDRPHWRPAWEHVAPTIWGMFQLGTEKAIDAPVATGAGFAVGPAFGWD
jgi:phage gpG-like protein